MRTTTKAAGTAGILWAIGNTVFGMMTGQPPALTASGGEIAAYLGDYRGQYLVAVAVFAATLPLVFVFFGNLGGAAREDRTSRAIVGPGLAFMLVCTALSYLLLAPVVFGDGLPALGDDLLRYLYVLTFQIAMIGNVAAAVVLVSAALVAGFGSRGQTVTRVAAGLLAAVSVVGLVNADVAQIGGAGFFVTSVWMIVVGVGMLRGGATVPGATPVPTT